MLLWRLSWRTRPLLTLSLTAGRSASRAACWFYDSRALSIPEGFNPLALSDREIDIIQRLAAKIRRDAFRLDLYNRYYEGVHNLEALGIAVPEELKRFTVMVNWPRIAADAVEERLDVDGFRAEDKSAADDLWRVWQANGLDDESQMAHLDAIVYGRSYICIGSNEHDENTPLITVESPLEMTATISPRTREVVEALRIVRDRDEDGKAVDRATLYLPDVTIHAEKRWSGTQRGWVESTDADGVPLRDQHNMGIVPVVPMVNRSRTSDREGVSEIQDVIDLTDAAARALTLAQLATEVLSVPQRAVLGASEEDFTDPETGKPLTKWEAYFGAVWAVENDKAKMHQFDAADLGNFATIINHYANHIGAVTGLPSRYFGQNTANPPSADGIRADESRLVKRAERRHRSFGGAWERVMRIVRRIQTKDAAALSKEITVVWRDPSTPTRAQTADAAVKLYQANVLPRRQVLRDLGYTPSDIDDIMEMFREEMELGDELARSIAAFRIAPGHDDAEPVVGDADEIKKAADAMGVMIRSGVDSDAAASAVGLGGIEFTGAVPASLRVPENEALEG